MPISDSSIYLSTALLEKKPVERQRPFVRDFKGNWSLKFTKGAGLPGEDMEVMFDNGDRDRYFSRTRSRGISTL